MKNFFDFNLRRWAILVFLCSHCVLVSGNYMGTRFDPGFYWVFFPLFLCSYLFNE